MAKVKRSLREICREVGVPHLQVTEVLKRIANSVKKDEEVITHDVGTFYLKKMKPRTRKNYGIEYQIPAREAVALRGPRFPGRPAPLMQMRVGAPGSDGPFDTFTPDGQTMPLDVNKSYDVTIDFGNNESVVWRVSVDVSLLDYDDVDDPGVWTWDYQITCLCVGLGSWPNGNSYQPWYEVDGVQEDLFVGAAVEYLGLQESTGNNSASRTVGLVKCGGAIAGVLQSRVTTYFAPT